MAISTYAELQSAVGNNWPDRTDLTSTRIQEFIALFEAKVNRNLRVRQQITTASLTPSSGSANLPADYLMWKRVTWEGSTQRELEFVDTSYLVAAYPDSPSDTPRFFTIEGGAIKIRPASDTNITLLYAQKVPALSDAATTNWLLTAHPDAYLFGSLAMLETFTGDDSALAKWNSLTANILGEIWNLSVSSQGPAMIRAYGSTP